MLNKFQNLFMREPILLWVQVVPTLSLYSFMFLPASKSDKFDDAELYVSYNTEIGEVSDLKIVVRHRDLSEIVASLKEYFDKASSADERVSEMLKTSRAQLDWSFRQLKKTIYHSSGVLSNLSSTWTSKSLLAVKY
ncbi:hypothetical protein PVL29_013732 [Vitis rotundifolia]|uniref:DUF632 domain-containing protein n=1 Tax=Vitis rotundifolia TaxID=103349 RepID=A0AA38ZMM7_VITRO|nr:hypothetical protein PVL29_013732 [Vitis rotundifolia]